MIQMKNTEFYIKLWCFNFCSAEQNWLPGRLVERLMRTVCLILS